VRYDIADEYVEVASKLWESWEEGALVEDMETGVYVDYTKVHAIDFEGKHFRSRGPLNTIRSPQVKPVFCQAGASNRGRDFAAKHAEVVLGLMTGVEGMKEFREDIRKRAAGFGRNPDDVKVFFLTPVTFTSPDMPELSEAQRQAMLEVTLVMSSSSMDIDLSKYDLDAPVDQNMEAGGHTSVLDYIKQLGREGKTLREALSVSFGDNDMNIRGTPEEVAEQMMVLMDEVGGDGFLISGNTSGYNHQLPDLFARVVPALQKAGAVRTEYRGATFRDILREF
jgi:alkanesulfonate monooxygenase SsuD/methylene tetrahydromethanopterin reductase-like flavin-dependent oxidoreductase (luciferase family)